jgi:hypothetical protein
MLTLPGRVLSRFAQQRTKRAVTARDARQQLAGFSGSAFELPSSRLTISASL